MEGVLWKMRVYAAGSWTGATHTNRLARAVAESTRGPVRPGEVPLGERCPVCRQGRGDLRHVIVWCCFEPLPAIRSTLWDAVEGRMQRAASPEWWRSQERAAAVRHPEGWEGLGTAEEADRWPVLTYAGWLRPTEGEAVLAAGLRAGTPVERGHDLGYRGVIPAGLAEVWRKEDAGGPKAAVVDIALAAMAKREVYAAATKAYVASAGPAGLGGPPAEEADSSAEEEWVRPAGVGAAWMRRPAAERDWRRLRASNSSLATRAIGLRVCASGTPPGR